MASVLRDDNVGGFPNSSFDDSPVGRRRRDGPFECPQWPLRSLGGLGCRRGGGSDGVRTELNCRIGESERRLLERSGFV